MSELPRLVCATANPHKVAEIAEILAGLVELLPRQNQPGRRAGVHDPERIKPA